MKTKIGLAVLALFFIGVIYSFVANEAGDQGVDKIYLLPSKFEGCVVINYNVEGALPLKTENNEIIYNVPENGIIETSSPSNTGWVNEEGSGWHKIRAFYVDEKGEIIEELPQEKIRFGANGSSQEEGKTEKHYSYQIFGSKETENKGCHPLDS